MQNHTTGQIFFRETGDKSQDGRKLVWFCGIVALDPESEIKGEHQYVVTGKTSWTIFPETGIDRTPEAKALGSEGILSKPIWRY